MTIDAQQTFSHYEYEEDDKTKPIAIHKYKVIKITNGITPRIGNLLFDSDIKALISDGHKVIIT